LGVGLNETAKGIENPAGFLYHAKNT